MAYIRELVREPVANVSFNIPKALYDRLEKRLPRRGDKQVVVIKLLEMFLNDEVKVVLSL